MLRFPKKPLSTLAAVGALGAILYGILQLAQKNLYLERLNYVDNTTLLLLGLLMLRGVSGLREESDLQTVSLALIACVSFIFGYEAIYKWSFYFAPWRMPPAELREFLIQAGTSLVFLAGFAQKKFSFTRGNVLAGALFAALWITWLLIGFPQISDGQPQHGVILPLSLSGDLIYYLNRGTKVAFFLIYFFLFRRAQSSRIPRT